ncbi:MAG: hypothetical protein ACRDZY_11720 [Acidimicrobiales bacterium]
MTTATGRPPALDRRPELLEARPAAEVVRTLGEGAEALLARRLGELLRAGS